MKKFSNNNKKVIDKFKKTPKIDWVDEFLCPRIIMYSFKCGDDNKKKIKRI